VCSRKGSLNVFGGLERGGWAREIQQQAHAMDPSMRCLAWPGSANGATHASPGQRPGSLKGRNKPWFVRTFRTGVAPSGLVGLGRGKTRGVAPGCLEAAPLGRPASGSLAKTASRSATPWVGKRGMPHTRTRRHEEDMRLGAQAEVHAHSWSWGWARHWTPPREGTRPTAWGSCGRAGWGLAGLRTAARCRCHFHSGPGLGALTRRSGVRLCRDDSVGREVMAKQMLAQAEE